MKLESAGIPYRHMFAVMKYANMKQIPKGYILRRWTIGVIENVMLNEDTIIEQKDNVSIIGHEGNKHKLFGIGYPKICCSQRCSKREKGNELVPSATILVTLNIHVLQWLDPNVVNALFWSPKILITSITPT